MNDHGKERSYCSRPSKKEQKQLQTKWLNSLRHNHKKRC